MPDAHDVAAVLADAPYHGDECPSPCYVDRHPEVILSALAAAGYAVVKVPEGVAMEHGARLYSCGEGDGAVGHLHIEATP